MIFTAMEWTPKIGHNRFSSSPTSSSRHTSNYVRGPISNISDNTRVENHSCQFRGSDVLAVWPGDATAMSNPVVGSPSTNHDRVTTLAANTSTDRITSSKLPNRDAMSLASTSATDISTSQHVLSRTSNPIPDDTTIDNLVSRMQDNVIIRDVAVQAPNMIDVPRGYAVTNDTKPADHYRDRREIKTHIKRKRDEGLIRKPVGQPELNEQYGFRANEINSAGAVSLENCQPSDLSNEVHPLLARDRFDDTPDAVYDQLVPGLRLASMFLTQPVCMQFWVTLAFANRRDDLDMSLKYGKRCQRIDRHVKMTKENIAKATNQLKTMGNANLIHFAFRHKTEMPQTDIWGCSWPIREYHGARQQCLTSSLIRLHADYYIVAEKLSQLKYPEQSQVLRFSFIFAAIVLHELVRLPAKILESSSLFNL